MDGDILNLEQAAGALVVSEKALIKLLREEHIPARKIGREWRFSQDALLRWLASGNSMGYISQNERYMVSKDTSGDTAGLFRTVRETLSTLSENGNNIRSVLKALDRGIVIPENATLRISYKQQREVEKLEFKIYWVLRREVRLNANRKVELPAKIEGSAER